jgi:hypothetical protein
MDQPKTPAASSLTKCDVDPARIEQTVKWLLTGARDADVIEAIRTTWPDQELQPLLVAAVGELSSSAEFSRKVVRGWCFEASKDLYRRMVEIGDFAGALRAIKQIKDLAA